ncbi:MAG: aminotransferase class IV [Bacteroidales bacterium]|nr:aminotransferase class IV [Bacteroidales bacterium]
MLHSYICLNGAYIKGNEPCLFPGNRAFRYADSLSENMHAFATEPQFLEHHLNRLTDNMQLLSMDVPAYFTAENLHQLIERLLNKNRIFGGAGIRLTVFRNNEQDFVPADHRVSFILESKPLKAGKYELNEKGHCIDICTEFIKVKGRLSGLRSSNSTMYLMAAMQGRKENMDAVILLNEDNRLVETTDSNIFLVSGNSVYTPGIDQGCIPGIMRRIVAGLANESGFSVNDQCSLTPMALDDAEEVFLTNATEGICWVGAYRKRRYYNKAAKQLTARLNNLAFGG